MEEGRRMNMQTTRVLIRHYSWFCKEGNISYICANNRMYNTKDKAKCELSRLHYNDEG
jgi:hypothetical protein